MAERAGTPRRVAILQGHPDPAAGHLCRALADAYAEGAAAAGHTVVRIEVATLDFPVLQTQEEFQSGAVPAGLAAAQDALVQAEHWAIFFPLWLGGMPALLKGFLEQVLRPGIAFEYGRRGFPRGRLGGRSARIVVTMGMPSFVYRLYYGAHGVRLLERSILGLVGVAPVGRTLLGMVEGSDRRRRRWLVRMRELGAQAG